MLNDKPESVDMLTIVTRAAVYGDRVARGGVGMAPATTCARSFAARWLGSQELLCPGTAVL
jgi:hypothetical protein